MSAARKRGRPETPPADYGPRVRLNNGTAFLTYRADPDRPQAPLIRAARAYVAYEALPLTDSQMAAANRIRNAAEAVSGARQADAGGLSGRAAWQVAGPSAIMVQAAADLRDVAAVLGRARELAVILLVVAGRKQDEGVVMAGLATMADYWNL